MKIIKVSAFIAVAMLGSAATADEREKQCEQMNITYKQSLEFAQKELERFPEIAANVEKKGLTLKDIQKLEKTMSACDLQALIYASLG